MGLERGMDRCGGRGLVGWVMRWLGDRGCAMGEGGRERRYCSRSVLEDSDFAYVCFLALL